jgi:predicted nucleic acid-binding protein
MIFADLAAGDSVFLDANTFIYHFSPDPALGPPCSQLLQRIENQELTGFTSVHLLAEVAGVKNRRQLLRPHSHPPIVEY